MIATSVSPSRGLTISDRVHQELREQILDWMPPPGAALAEVELADQHVARPGTAPAENQGTEVLDAVVHGFTGAQLTA